MILKVLNLNNDEETKMYKDTLDNFESNYPHYMPYFLDLYYSGLSKAKAFILYNSLNTPVVVMPFYLRQINKQLDDGNIYYDAITTWGYSGPLYNEGMSPDILFLFWREVDAWYKANHVISEFIRFNLNENHVNYSGTIVPVMHNIKGKLLEPEVIWGNYNRKVRKNINRARRENLKVKIFHKNISDETFDQFNDIFVHTMERTDAADEYYFSYDKLKLFIDHYPDNCAIALTFKDELPISSELVLISKHSIYSFIGGTLAEYFGLRPNEILKHEVIEWAHQNGFNYFVLGGGYGKDDGIFRYKQAFFPDDVCSYYTGRKIIDQEAYNQLAKIEGSHYNIKDDFFPLYRKPKS